MNTVIAENLTYTYQNFTKPSLKHVSLEIKPGELVLIAGKSGSGKTTLARCLCGLIPHIFGGEMRGRVVVCGKETGKTPVYELARNIGFVFQNPESQFCTLEVKDEVIFGPENLCLPKGEIEQRYNWALKCVKMENVNSPLQNLSYGQKQRIAIASILSMSPQVLVLDEPFSNVDYETSKTILKTLLDLKAVHGKTLILIEHRITSNILSHLDRIVVLEDGNVVYNSTQPLDVQSNILKKYVSTILRLDNSPASNDTLSQAKANTTNKVMELKSILYQYGKDFKLEIDNLSIFEGEILAVIGENGSGKTTLARVIAGFLKPKKGQVLKTPKDLRVGMVFQNPEIHLFNTTVWKEVAFGFKRFSTEKQLNTVNESVKRELETVRLLSKKEAHPQSLSHGEKQRLALIAILATKPKVLILDEPTTGQDKHHLNLLMHRLINLKNEGMSVILITHDWDFASQITDRVIVLKDGKILKSNSSCSE